MCCLLVYASIVAMLLIVSGDVELNPGPCKKCPKCESMVSNRMINCKCGYTFRKCSARKVVTNETKRLKMITRRACESETERMLRKDANKLAMSKKRLLETDDEALCRKVANKFAMQCKKVFLKLMTKHYVEGSQINLQ